MSVTMLPSEELLTPPSPGSAILPDGHPVPELRAELRRIPSVLNGVSVLSFYVQTLVIIVGAILLHNPFAWVAAFLLMGRANAQVLSLMHESAHRLLFKNRKLNDWFGRWIVGYPSFTNTDAYRRVHMAHHRDELGPDEPDLALYNGYPITRASLRRKLFRDITGQTAFREFRTKIKYRKQIPAKSRRASVKIWAIQLVLIGVSILSGYPLVWLLLWWLPHHTIWRFTNRLRAIAEHAGMQRSTDRRLTTHSVTQHWLARTFMVPYWIGWHLAHHCDAGVPMRNLRRFHHELITSGYIAPGLEYPNYPALWRKLGSKPETPLAA